MLTYTKCLCAMYNIKYLCSWICIFNNLKLIVISKCKLKYIYTLTLFFRAEILYRCQIPPFAQSRSVLEPLLNNVKTEEPDILELCHIVPKEVLSLDGGKGVSKINFFNKWTHTKKFFAVLKIQQPISRPIKTSLCIRPD